MVFLCCTQYLCIPDAFFSRVPGEDRHRQVQASPKMLTPGKVERRPVQQADIRQGVAKASPTSEHQAKSAKMMRPKDGGFVPIPHNKVEVSADNACTERSNADDGESVARSATIATEQGRPAGASKTMTYQEKPPHAQRRAVHFCLP